MCHKSAEAVDLCSAAETVVRSIAFPGGLSGDSEGYRDSGPRAAQVEHLQNLLMDLVFKFGPVGGEPHEDDSGVDGCGWCLALRGHVSRIPDSQGVVKDS